MLAMVFYLAFVAIAASNINQDGATLLATTKLQLPERQLSAEQWRSGDWRLLPDQRSRFGPPERKRFDLQFAGSIEDLSNRLIEHGWRKARISDLSEALRVFLSRSGRTGEPLHLPRDFAGFPERQILIKDQPDGSRLILRIWDSGTQLDNQTLWLGQVRTLEYQRGVAGFERWHEIGRAEEAMHQLLESLGAGVRVTRPEVYPVLIRL